MSSVLDHRAGEGDEYLPWANPQFRHDPYPWYARLREDHPVYEIAPGSYVLTRYHDVLHCATHHRTTVGPAWADAGAWRVNASTIIGTDAPEHTHLRRQTNRWFTPKLVKQWVLATTEQTNLALDRIGEDGRVEAWMELCVRPTHVTMARVLGLREDGEQALAAGMLDAMSMLSEAPVPGAGERAAAAFDRLGADIDAMLEEHAQTPVDGLAQALLDAQTRGDMTAEQSKATIMLFYALGHMDVGFLIASGFEQFTRIPGLFETFKAEPASRKAIINEMARLDPAELAFVRHPTEDLEFSGVVVPAGSQIRCMIGAANRDPEVFENPDVFDHTRPAQASRNLTFGAGIHNCAGQVISRAEIEAIYTAIAERYDHIELDGSPETDHHDFARSYQRLPLRLS
jgi:cytochrome P450